MSMSECSNSSSYPLPASTDDADAITMQVAEDICTTDGPLNKADETTADDSRCAKKRRNTSKNVIGLEIVVEVDSSSDSLSNCKSMAALKEQISSADFDRTNNSEKARTSIKDDIPSLPHMPDKMVRTMSHRMDRNRDKPIPSLQAEAIANETQFKRFDLPDDMDDYQPSDDDSASSTRFGTLHRPWPKMMNTTLSHCQLKRNCNRKGFSRLKFVAEQLSQSLAAEIDYS